MPLKTPTVFAAHLGRRVRYVGASPCARCGKKIEAPPTRYRGEAATDAFVLFHTRAKCEECK